MQCNYISTCAGYLLLQLVWFGHSLLPWPMERKTWRLVREIDEKHKSTKTRSKSLILGSGLQEKEHLIDYYYYHEYATCLWWLQSWFLLYRVMLSSVVLAWKHSQPGGGWTLHRISTTVVCIVYRWYHRFVQRYSTMEILDYLYWLCWTVLDSLSTVWGCIISHCY